MKVLVKVLAKNWGLALILFAAIAGIKGVNILNSEPTGGTFGPKHWEQLGTALVVFSAGSFVLGTVLCIVGFRKRD